MSYVFECDVCGEPLRPATVKKGLTTCKSCRTEEKSGASVSRDEVGGKRDGRSRFRNLSDEYTPDDDY